MEENDLAKRDIRHQKEFDAPVDLVSSATFQPMAEAIELRALFEQIGERTNFTFSVIHPIAGVLQTTGKNGVYNGWASTFEKLNDYLKTTGIIVE